MRRNVEKNIVKPIDRKGTGLALYQLRERFGYSTEDICNFLELESSRAVYKWEAGQTMPSLDHLVALCTTVYGVSLESVLRYIGDSEPVSDLHPERIA